MKILTAQQIKELDRATIVNEPIPSLDLMERAATVFVQYFIELFPDTERKVAIFCGPGNNGGDGLAVARLLHQKHYDVYVYICRISNQFSADAEANMQRLPAFEAIDVTDIHKGDNFPHLPTATIIIDAIFGSGLNRSVDGYWAELLQFINTTQNTIVSIDIPSGMFCDQHTAGVSIHADHTLSFQLPKAAFLFPENGKRVGEWSCRSIGLHAPTLQNIQTDTYFINNALASFFVKKAK